MSSIDVPLKGGSFGTAKFGQTQRKDKWWLEPLLIFVGYAIFIAYANYAIINYNCGGRPCYEVPGTGYLSPMFSPLLTTNAPTWWPSYAPFFGTMLILWAPLGFRFTCYYYRGAYYKGWWADPSVVRCRRASQDLLGRAQVAAADSKRAPLFSVLRDPLHLHPGL